MIKAASLLTIPAVSGNMIAPPVELKGGFVFMTYRTILYTRQDNVVYLTLNCPEVGNIIDQQLAWELEAACRRINQDDTVYVVVITGAGDKAFCGGNELEQELLETGGMVKEPLPPRYSVAAPVAAIKCPVIVALNGDALGQGLELALAGDIRLAKAGVKLGFPQVGLGLVPADGGTQRLPRVVGRGKALELLLGAGVIDASEAYHIGLVNRVVTGDGLAAQAQAMAVAIAGKGPVSVKYAREAINKGADLTLEQGLHLEANLYFLLQTTVDRKEGIEAFLQKRHPQFQGK